MRHSIPLLLSCLFVTATAVAEVPQTFDKHYPLQGRAELELEAGMGSIRATSCGSCTDIHVHVEMNDMDRSRFRIEESQNGNHVRFALKQDDSNHWHSNGKGPELTVEMPQEASGNLHSGNGSMSLTGVHGDLSLTTGNGSLTVTDAGGQMKLHTGNGSLSGSNLNGTVDASTGNGSLHLAGRFDRLQAHTGNGGMQLEAGGPNALRNGADISSGTGGVTLRLARDARATVQLSTGTGGVHSDLPLMMQGDLSDRHTLDGTLNGGGATVRVHTGTGGVHLEAL